MLNKPLLVFVFVVSVFLPSAAFASCSAAGYSIVYINGINTPNAAAQDDKREFTRRYLAKTSTFDPTFVLGYNPTNGTTTDIWDSIRQSIEPQVLEDGDLQSMLKTLHSDIKTRRVLIVGHSQGAFYANAVYDFLIKHGMEESAVAVYNVATPASGVAGGGGYLTSSNDKVINEARGDQEEFGGLIALPANVTLPLPENEVADPYGGHYFRSDYLALADIRIVQDMNFALRFLKTQKGDDQTGYCFDLPVFTNTATVHNYIGSSIQTR